MVVWKAQGKGVDHWQAYGEIWVCWPGPAGPFIAKCHCQPHSWNHTTCAGWGLLASYSAQNQKL